MNFPIIRHINDVLPAIEGRDEFVVGRRDGYTFIDYNYAQSDTFDCPIRRECRGLKFDMNGRLIARPFHKFFNLHEKPAEVPTSWDGAVIMEKLDGSMVHPAMVNGALYFMTRAGVTDQANMAMDYVLHRHPFGALSFCVRLLRMGLTPIFEFTSPHNQIVVRYSEPRLTLLAIRHTMNGEYAPHEIVETTGRDHRVAVVRTFDNSLHDMETFLHHTRELKGMEGYVVRVGQQLIKVKADEYVAAHRAKSGLLWEKDVLRLVLESKVDDVAALLAPEEAERLLRWSDRVLQRIGVAAQITRTNYSRMVHPSPNRREFAQKVLDRYPDDPAVRSWLFSIYDGRAPFEVVRAYGLKQTSNTAKARDFLRLLDVDEWKPFAVEMDE